MIVMVMIMVVVVMVMIGHGVAQFFALFPFNNLMLGKRWFLLEINKIMSCFY